MIYTEQAQSAIAAAKKAESTFLNNLFFIFYPLYICIIAIKYRCYFLHR